MAARRKRVEIKLRYHAAKDVWFGGRDLRIYICPEGLEAEFPELDRSRPCWLVLTNYPVQGATRHKRNMFTYVDSVPISAHYADFLARHRLREFWCWCEVEA